MNEALDARATSAWVSDFIVSFAANRESLTELDRQSGDGDFGLNLQVAFESVIKSLNSESVVFAGGAFALLSAALMKVGGTSGPLYGMWFRELAKAGAEVEELTLGDLSGGVAAGVAMVQRFGKAELGDCTMVDAMIPSAEALAAASDAGESLGVALGAAAAAARVGAESTASMLARRGRASYVGEAARGILDPGAVTVALFFESAPPLRVISTDI